MSQERRPGLLSQLSDELADAAARAGRSVYTVHGGRRSPGSGVAWPGGYVVTADHILFPDVLFFRGGPRMARGFGGRKFTVPVSEPEEPREFTITRPDGQQEAATLVGHDASTDLAVLKPASGSGQPPEMAPLGSVRSGNLVLALGRPGGDIASSLGVVSSVGERWWTARGGVIEAYVRADVTMLPGFSGGPLVDVEGRVIGMNSSLLGRGEHVAIPATIVDGTVQKLISGQPVKRAYLGITSQPTTLVQALREQAGLAQERALLIMWVEPGSPAEQAGLMVGDLLVRIGEQAVSNARDLLEALTPDRVGKPATVTVLRGGNPLQLTLTPTERA